VIVDCAVYKRGRRREGQLTVDAAVRACQDDDAFVWIGLYEPTEEEFEHVTNAFGLHEMAVEDAIQAHQRPKLEDYDNCLFLVLKPARYADREQMIEFGEILIFVGDNFVVTVRHGKAGDLAAVRRLAESRPDLLALGPSAVAYHILDQIVDDYRSVIDDFEQDMQEVEGQVLLEAKKGSAQRIYRLKREVFEFHMATAPLLEPLEWLQRRKVRHVSEEMTEYLRDVHDHLQLVVRDVHRLRELLSNAMDLYLSHTSAQLNGTMKQLTIIASLFLPLTFLTGFFGMNFAFLVGKISTYREFEIGVGVMLATTIVQLVIFRRRRLI
jgi:magnesium transporter